MTMTEPLLVVFALLVGILLGAFFFGGLWWTIRKGIQSKRVALWSFGSMLLRTGVVMLGFYLLLGDSWQRMLVGLLGFFIARVLVTWLTRVVVQPRPLAQEADHAP
jgi:F1F0 ATPase subunit 2